MSVFKCKMCGGKLDVKYGDKVVVCPYCGVTQTIQIFSEPKIQELYNRATNYLKHNEYDKAENFFEQILLLNNRLSDVYWNILMCRYGVTYVKDPKTNKYIPTCNRTLYTSVFDDENYAKAIETAENHDEVKYYKETAKEIENIQRSIISISKKEKPFDVFISYKDKNENGSCTKDSLVAQDLYTKLTDLGYKCFFSRITLENKIGIEYEPYIYSALATSKVMIVIGSSHKNLDAVWVKNEWNRFISFARNDASKTIIPLYFDMQADELPGELLNLPSYNISEPGVEQELLRGIKKLIPSPVMLLEKRKRSKKIIKTVALLTAIVMVIGTAFSIPWLMKLPKYNEAMQLYYDKKYAEATWEFSDLGNYRDSEKMKATCEDSWRKSLSLPFTSVMYAYPSGKMLGSIYIDQNGFLQYEGAISTANDFNNTEHGKIISLVDDFDDTVLYEDGLVSVSGNIVNKEKWHDIIQISRNLSQFAVALRSDGTVVYDALYEGNLRYPQSTSSLWLQPLNEWTNITALAWMVPDPFGDWEGYLDDRHATIIGLKSNGDMEFLESTGKQFTIDASDAKQYISDYVSNYNGSEFSNNILRYVKYKSDGTVVDKSNSPIQKDVLYATDYYSITKNGTLIYGSSDYEEDKKIITYPEWKYKFYFVGGEN